MISNLEVLGLYTIDLLPVLAALPESQLDYGYDHSHYGPITNNVIAQRISSEICRQ